MAKVATNVLCMDVVLTLENGMPFASIPDEFFAENLAELCDQCYFLNNDDLLVKGISPTDLGTFLVAIGKLSL